MELATMYTPTLDQVKALADEGANLIPVYREISADLETPVSAYLKIARSPYSFLLESVEGGERQARYSFIGTEPYRVLRTGPGTEAGAIDPLLPVEEELASYRPARVEGLPRSWAAPSATWPTSASATSSLVSRRRMPTLSACQRRCSCSPTPSLCSTT